ncbi:MAG: 5-formyltetrahydrofolate cyclo-ligase [Alistipes sp.]
MTKSEIRREMRALNRSLSAEQRALSAAHIMAQAEQVAAFMAADTVALFCSLPDEPPTEEMIARWSGGKRIVLPRVEGEVMQFYAYNPAVMHTGAFGISEPEEGVVCDPAEIDLIFVPGVAFTPSGGRLGRGRGYYDKYMSRSGFRAVKFGICYAHQVVADLPVEPHDIGVDRLICD